MSNERDLAKWIQQQAPVTAIPTPTKASQVVTPPPPPVQARVSPELQAMPPVTEVSVEPLPSTPPTRTTLPQEQERAFAASMSYLEMERAEGLGIGVGGAASLVHFDERTKRYMPRTTKMGSRVSPHKTTGEPNPLYEADAMGVDTYLTIRVPKALYQAVYDDYLTSVHQATGGRSTIAHIDFNVMMLVNMIESPTLKRALLEGLMPRFKDLAPLQDEWVRRYERHGGGTGGLSTAQMDRLQDMHVQLSQQVDKLAQQQALQTARDVSTTTHVQGMERLLSAFVMMYTSMSTIPTTPDGLAAMLSYDDIVKLSDAVYTTGVQAVRRETQLQQSAIRKKM